MTARVPARPAEFCRAVGRKPVPWVFEFGRWKVADCGIGRGPRLPTFSLKCVPRPSVSSTAGSRGCTRRTRSRRPECSSAQSRSSWHGEPLLQLADNPGLFNGDMDKLEILRWMLSAAEADPFRAGQCPASPSRFWIEFAPAGTTWHRSVGETPCRSRYSVRLRRCPTRSRPGCAE